MIKRNPQPRCVSKLYSPEGEYLFTIYNEWQLNDVRLQIAKQNLEGYYLIWKKERININKWGDCDNWHKGFYDLKFNQILELFKNRHDKTKS